MLRRKLHNPFGSPILYFETIGSTMETARRLVAAGYHHGTVVRAGVQTKGRGRREGRRWESARGESLLVTIVLETGSIVEPVHALPIILGLSVCDVVEKLTGKRCEVKWPNDVLCEGRKISGVLCESDGSAVLGGIGLNCNQRSFPAELETAATSLRIVRGRSVDIDRTLEELLGAIKTRLGNRNWREEVESRLYLRGEIVDATIETAGTVERCRIRVEGIGDSGQLLLLEPGSGAIRELFGGEVTFAVKRPPGSGQLDARGGKPG